MVALPDEAEITGYWREALVQFDASLLGEINIPVEARCFLQTIGVPATFREGLNWNIRVKPNPQITFLQRGNFRYAVFAEGEGETMICLEEPRGKVVATHDLDPKLTPMNTSVQSLVIYELLLSRFLDQGREVSQAERLRILEVVKSQLLQQDAAALADPDNWWSTFIEELETFDG